MTDRDISALMDELLPNTSEIAKRITDSAGTPIFEFMPIDEFQRLASSDFAEGAKVYWREILYRAHLAAVAALARHSRWIDSCLRNYSPGSNFLGFACCLRGLLESSSDIFYSLRGVPLTIAGSIVQVRQALMGELRTAGYASEKLENLLIHFIYQGG
jgi:hypothetical protein